MTALILVDIQNDFIPGGALAVPGGDEVVAVANAQMPRYKLVVATQDWHPPDHLSFASQHQGRRVGEVIAVDGLEQRLWPDHCVQHTPGAGFCSGLDVAGIQHVVRKGQDRRIDSYSGFFDNGRRRATGLEELLRGQGVTGVDIVGLALDVCVKFTALDAQRAGLRTRVLLEGCRGVELNEGDGARALAELRAAGVEVAD